MGKFSRIRGTEDRYGYDANSIITLTDTFSYIASLNGCKSLITPIFENADLFVRSVGDTSDIVTKEFYDFKDKSNRNIVLRPEGTVGIIRALIENKIIYSRPLPIRVSYTGPMFRYERPQSGRLRQFNQFGIEIVGTNSIYDDADSLIIADRCLKALKLKNYKILINNIGNYESRKEWIDELKKYFSKYKDQLSVDSQKRINTNPLRILDDKVDGAKDFVKNAPKIEAFLTKEEKEAFASIVQILTSFGLKFTVDKTLVRGLDYYTNFVFEIVSTSDTLRGQSTLVGGGRYSYLVKELGGPDLSCVGFAIGLERLLIQLKSENIMVAPNPSVDVYIACISDAKDVKDGSFSLANVLRVNQISTIVNLDSSKLDKHFKQAKDANAKYVLILGEKEFKTNTVTIKNQESMKQESVPLSNLISYIKGAKN